MMTTLQSIDPATLELVWEGDIASPADCAMAVEGARETLARWAATPLDERIAVARRYAMILDQRREHLAETISRETGKLLSETRAEVGAMIAKVEISIASQAERAGTRCRDTEFGRAVLRHRPHGVMAVLGPYNFPGHLPNGHIVPALLAGNVVVFKPSEEAPLTGLTIAAAWNDAGLPANVLQVLPGGRATGEALLQCDIDGLLFTGSSTAGRHFRWLFVDRPNVMLALELGGNNPLVAWDGDPAAVAAIVHESAFVTTGQRCSCARRLIVPTGKTGDQIVEALVAAIDATRISAWNHPEAAFMGPLVSERAADAARKALCALGDTGGRVIRSLDHAGERSRAFVSPALVDTRGCKAPDEEIFAPLLQLQRVTQFKDAIAAARSTRFGLSAGLISGDDALWSGFLAEVPAGIVNRNRPTTGAASDMPFGGIGESGNHRPGAWYAADYCAYPVTSFEAAAV